MSVINFPEEVAKLAEGERKDVFKGADFDITLHKGSGRLHACGADEFYYVLTGEGGLVIENEIHLLKAGEGIVVEAGKKHKRVTPGALWMTIAKQPHKHVSYEGKGLPETK
jgi:mannose-6-phosphate isomerase-like protein (cupin superfamily)